MKNIKLAVVDDHLLFRKGMVALLREFEGLTVEFDAENGQDFLNKLPGQAIDVVLLDLDMPVLNGFKTVKALKKNHKDIKIVILSMHNEPEVVEALLHAGANGFLIKNQDIEIVIECIQTIVETGFYFNPGIPEQQVQNLIDSDQLFARFKTAKFTRREIQIIEQVCKLHTNKKIATNLELSVKTVNGYLERIFHKTSVKNRTGVVMYAIKHNMIQKIST